MSITTTTSAGAARPTVLARLARGISLMLPVAIALAASTTVHADDTISVTDVAGRTVTVPHGAKHVLLGEGRLFYATALLDREQPFARIVALADDLKQNDPDTWDQYVARLPEAGKVATVGAVSNSDFSIETAVSLGTDLVVASLSFREKLEGTGVVEKLDKAGIPLVFIDFRENPTANTVPSMLLLGRVFAREAAAQDYIDFYLREMGKVTGRVAKLKDADRPLVFAERAAGYSDAACCATFGNTNFGAFIADAGGRNWGTPLFQGLGGQVNPEKVLVDDPPFLLMTGANWSHANPATKAVLLGYEADAGAIQKQIASLVSRPIFADLAAVKQKRVMAIYHQFYQSPYHVVAIQALAKWLHPELFADLDPEATFRELHDRFLPIAYKGVFWAELH